jgi:hypothetical protein
VNAIQTPLSGLKMFSKSLSKHLKGFGSTFAELPAALVADTLLDFCHPSQTKRNTKSKKALL